MIAPRHHTRMNVAFEMIRSDPFAFLYKLIRIIFLFFHVDNQ